MKPPRGLTREEAALWRKLTATVTPLNPPRHGEVASRSDDGGGSPSGVVLVESTLHHAALRRGPPPLLSLSKGGEDQKQKPPLLSSHGLDASWDRRLRAGALSPDFTLDLHGHTLDQAHRRLDMGLGQARAMGVRVVLLITGKARPADPAGRGERRGAIRAKVLDWLAAGPHAGHIAAIRKAHRRHGGDGALYLVLKRGR